MFRNYVTIALRNLKRHSGYTFINLFGLATGLAAATLIFLYVFDEFQYDRYHEKADRIYRIGLDAVVGGATIHTMTTAAPMAAALVREFPFVEEGVRFLGEGRYLVEQGDQRYYEESFRWADSTVFDVFTWPLVAGNPETALDAPFSVVISESTARKYFGSNDPMGKVLEVDRENAYTVTGVMRDLPRTSHFSMDFVASMSSLPWSRDDAWLSNSFATYVLLREGYGPDDLTRGFPGLIRKYVAPQGEQALGQSFDQAVASGLRWGFFVEPLGSIRLHSTADNDFAPHGDIRYVYVLGVIAAFILLIACINFMNLSTARSANRAKEVGLRKVMGSGRGKLVFQFLGESVFLSLAAVLLAYALLLVTLPLFRGLSGKELALNLWMGLALFGFMGGAALVLGLLAGLYPAFVLSAFTPSSVLKGSMARGARGSWLRRGLVIVQFSISLVLLVGTSVVFKQIRYMQEQKLGFTADQVIIVPIESEASRQGFNTLRQDLLTTPGLLQVAAASVVPGRFMENQSAYRPEGQARDAIFPLWTGRVSPDYLRTLETAFVAGRDFRSSADAEPTDPCIINESAARLMGLTPETAVGKRLDEVGGSNDNSDFTRTIVGVTRDFHVESLREPIKPVILTLTKGYYNYILVRVQANAVPQALEALERKWKTFAPDYPYQYSFLDQEFSRQYTQEQRLGRIFVCFTVLAFLIAGLGLFGLASYLTGQRTKEIGIRKTLGASVPGIILLLTREFVKLVLVAFVLAGPVAYLGMHRWLDDFSYRTGIGPDVFLLAFIIALVVAVATVSYQSVRAALADPVQSLRYE